MRYDCERWLLMVEKIGRSTSTCYKSLRLHY